MNLVYLADTAVHFLYPAVSPRFSIYDQSRPTTSLNTKLTQYNNQRYPKINHNPAAKSISATLLPPKRGAAAERGYNQDSTATIK